VSNGRRGDEPSWHRSIRAARLASVAPWGMHAAPLEWRERVLVAAGVEHEVAEQRERRQRLQQSRRR
jgi:predicted amidohydrolase